MSKTSKASQILWLIMGSMAFVAGLHKTYNHGIENSLLFFDKPAK